MRFDLPYTLERGKYVVTVETAAGPRRFAFDTGASKTCISERLSRELGLAASGRGTSGDFEGHRHAITYVRVPYLRMGEATYSDRQEIVLPDSTHVWLNAGTKLIYPKQFNRSMRQVYLSGEMFADVRRDEDRPFIVSADRLEVKVLGTQFNLKSYQEDAKSEVSLVRGKVSVGIKASKMNGKLTLAPGDILRFNKTNNHIDFLNFDPDSYANWIDNNNFFFVEQTLGDIVADLRRHFAVEIVVTDKSLCDETYYASFVNEESLDEILDALNKDRLFSVRREAEVYYISPPLK